MSTKQLITTADQVFAGRAYDPGLYGVTKYKGRPISFLTKVDLGTPLLEVADSLIKAATSTEQPNAATKTYVPGVVTSPLDSADLPSTATIQTVDGQVLCWVLDVPRGVTSVVTHGSAVVASTIIITGYDLYRAKMVEEHRITAGTTSKTIAGKKAFKYISKIEIVSAGNATTNTANIGFNKAIGLPYKLADYADLFSTWFNDTVETTTSIAKADTTATQTAITGDVRGAIVPAGTLDGAKTLKVWMHISDADAATPRGLLGKAQYTG